jgi:hypothetical protein
MGRPLATNIARQQMSALRGIATALHVFDILGQIMSGLSIGGYFIAFAYRLRRLYLV